MSGTASHGLRVLAIIPAHNEGETVAEVVADVRRLAPGVDVVVVDPITKLYLPMLHQ